MSDSPPAFGPALSDHLQRLTEALAAGHTQDEVLSAALQPAMEALNAVAGAILLLHPETHCLSVAALQGHDAQTVWQDGPLSPETPAGDVITARHPLYFEHAGALKAAYPQLEAHTGGIASVATGILPLLLEGQPLGVLILDFREPHTFTLEKRRFPSTLASQTSVALGRIQLIGTLEAQVEQRTQELQRQTAELEAIFTSLPEAIYVGNASGITRANLVALEMLGFGSLEDLNRHIHQLADQLQNRDPLTLERLRPEEEAFAIALQGTPHTYEVLSTHQQTGEARLLRSAAAPVLLDGQVIGAVAINSDLTDQQQVRETRELNALLEQRVQERTTALEAEQAAMQTFVQFTEAASQISDVGELARLALETLRSLIPGANVVLTELTPTHWHLRQWTDNLDPELLAMARQQGFPLDTPVFAELLRTGEPSFTDAWDEHEQEVAHTAQFQAVAHYPIHQAGQVVAAIGVAVTNQRFWTETQQAIVRSVGRSFTFLYDRLSVAQQLQEQNSELRARTRMLEGIEQLTTVRDELTTDPVTLIRRVQALVLDLLPLGFAAYYEAQDGRWRLLAQTGDAGLSALQAAIDAGFPVGQTPSFDWVAQTREPAFVDSYVQDADVSGGEANHVAAHATLPLMVGEQVRGLFNLPLFHHRQWTEADRALLTTAVQTLGLVLERAESFEALEQSNRELQASNEELEAFTYSASHDLRTPVRHVMGFTELAERALEKTPNERVQQHLNVVKQAAKRMTDLIDGMLLLSRSGRQNVRAQPVDLNLLVTQARRDAVAEFGSHPVRWQLGELPTVQGDHSLLQQVMTNLLSNAVKYSAKREVFEVGVWCEESTSEWTISVQDNGIGFEPQYAQKLFGIFQRLHTEKDFKGVGVGLATVRRIVQRHGGQVFAESDGQTGATFGFTLPKEGQRPQSLL